MNTPVKKRRHKPAVNPKGAMSLRELREAVKKTQSDVARLTSMSQPQLSRFEGRQDHLTSTLRRYVRALGGEVEVVARLGAKRIVLRDV
jgi:predicted transcriptional regulator